ncbi:MAG: plasmid pRiA4b ORF-3 family protein [Bacteroidales bacterium]|nr:plasmid pRiA4b ORF-3 family protein [Bacteroidales bacterium]
MIYRFVAISDEEDSFIREFELKETDNLLDFHNALQEELEYDMSQMASFFTASKKWEKEEEFTLFEMGPGTSLMEAVTIDDIVIDKNQKLLYIFDQFNERALFLEATGTTDEIDGREYPSCTRSQGKPPKQVQFANFIDPVIKIDAGFEDEDDNDLADDPDLSDLEGLEEEDEI